MSWRLYHNFQGLLLVAWGLFLLDRASSGRLLFYINSRYVALTIFAAFMFFGMAQAVMRHGSQKRAQQPDVCEQAHAEEEAHIHRHNPSGWALLALAFPLLLGLVVPARALGSETANMRSMNTAGPSGSQSNVSMTPVELSSDERSVLDWVALFNSNSDFSAYHGQTADVSGFVYHFPGLPQDEFLVSRFVVTCCVADASVLGMLVSGSEGNRFDDNQWVRVQGIVDSASVGGQAFPAIRADSVERIDAPDQPYLYP